MRRTRFDVLPGHRARGHGVTINSVSGDVVAKGMQGQMSVKLISGDIDISGGARLTEVRTFSGDVTLDRHHQR